MLERIGNDRHAEAGFLRIADRQAHAVHRHRAFLHGAETAALRLVFESEVPAAVGVFLRGADGRLIDVPLHDVAVEQRIGFHRAFEVHQITRLQQAEVAFVERLLHRGNGIGVVADVHNCQTYAVMCYALIDFQLFAEVRAKRKILVLTVGADLHDLPHAFHDT